MPLAVFEGADVDVTVSDGQSAVTVQLESINPCIDCEEYFEWTPDELLESINPCYDCEAYFDADKRREEYNESVDNMIM